MQYMMRPMPNEGSMTAGVKVRPDTCGGVHTQHDHEVERAGTLAGARGPAGV